MCMCLHKCMCVLAGRCHLWGLGAGRRWRGVAWQPDTELGHTGGTSSCPVGQVHQIWTLQALPSLHPSTSVNTLFAWFVGLVLFRWSIDKSQFCQQPLGDISPARGSFIPVPKGGSHECHFFIDSGPGVRRASREMEVGKMAESRTFRLF